MNNTNQVDRDYRYEWAASYQAKHPVDWDSEAIPGLPLLQEVEESKYNCNTPHHTIEVPALETMDQQIDFMNKLRSDDIASRQEKRNAVIYVNIVDEVMIELNRNHSRYLDADLKNYKTLQNIYEKFHSEEVFGTMRRQDIVKIMAELIDFGHKYIE